jgi:uncharacterized membrane protein
MSETETTIEPEIIEQPCDSPVDSVAVASKPVQPTGISPMQMEKLIGTTLLVGVVTSTIIVFLGGVVYVLRHSSAAVHYRVFRGEPSDLRTLRGIWEEVKTFSGRGIIQLGLISLVCLQVGRIILVGVLFLKIRDRLYVAVSAIVVVLLLYGLLIESAIRH